MIDVETIKKLSTEEKLVIMETIWEDLSSNGGAVESPDWHEEELAKVKKETRGRSGKYIGLVKC